MDDTGFGARPDGIPAALTLGVSLIAFLHRADTAIYSKDMLM